jgi:hypothetical protein
MSHGLDLAERKVRHGLLVGALEGANVGDGPVSRRVA